MHRSFFAVAALLIGCSGPGQPDLDGGPAPDTGMSDGAGGNGVEDCAGCVSLAGQCVNGDQMNACGADGDECIGCIAGEVCSERGECVAAPACGPDTCDGCCLDGECVTTASPDACGRGGLVCAQCAAGATCEGGACAQPCGPSNCPGCCDPSGACVRGVDDIRCGVRGGECIDCTTIASSCSAGRCVPPACSQSCPNGCCSGGQCVTAGLDSQCGTGGEACTDCRQGRTCTTGMCILETESLWDIVLVSGTVSEMFPTGGSWDGFNGLPDPLVIMRVGLRSGQSTVVNDSLAPVWNETVLAGIVAADLFDELQILYRDDDVTLDDTICDITLSLNAEHDAFTGRLIESECPGAPGNLVRWKLEPSN